MLPTKESNLVDCTNFFRREGASTGLLTPPSERKRVRQREFDARDKKRPKLNLDAAEQKEDVFAADDDSDEEMVNGTQRRRTYPFSVHALRDRVMLGGRLNVSRQSYMPTRSVLQSFVSSNKVDIFKCHSIDEQSFTTLPYACSYSHDAKLGGTPHLAVGTEQGTVHILDTSRRQPWDAEPQRVTLQPHDQNGIFDVKWSPSDTLLATASGDQSVRISALSSSVSTSNRILHVLYGHESTVKCVAWDPSHDGAVLCSGGRNGSICLWDLRAGELRGESGSLAPVLTISKAHEGEAKTPKAKGKRMLTKQEPLKSITHLLYTDAHPYGIVSSSSYDGILKLWDARLPTASRKPAKPARPYPVTTSPADPTTYNGTRRERGITTLAAGSGPTAGLLFALGTDARVHAYITPTLAPLALPRTAEPDMGAQTLPTHSFYVRLAASPCGRWLASGSAGGGRAYLFDAAAAAAPPRGARAGEGVPWAGGVALEGGQTGEVGAMDWADGALATCADDGTVRVWRPDVEVARRCEDDPEEMKWEWAWASSA